MLPSAIVAIESLPLTPNGKVDRRELAAREVHVGGERPYVPPRTTTEELLCDIWQEVLHAERVGIDDNFFDLGGDSILTIQVIVKARAAGFGVECPATLPVPDCSRAGPGAGTCAGKLPLLLQRQHRSV